MTPDDLRAARDRLGMSEAALARALGVHVSAVYRWQAGERPMPPYLWRAMRDLEREATATTDAQASSARSGH